MTDEQCMSIWAKYGFEALKIITQNPEAFKAIPPGVFSAIDSEGFRFFLTAWKPSYEDLQALNRGEPIYIKTISNGLPPMALFTMNEKGECNDI